MTESRDLIGSTEAAAITGADARTIQRWAATGTLAPAVKLPGRTGAYLFHRADVEALATRKSVAA